MDGKPDIVEMLEAEGMTLKSRGRALWGLCPFHADKHPSMKINRDSQTFHCFGCGAHGDVIDFTQRLHNLSFKVALRYLGMTPGKPPVVDPRVKRKRELLKDFERWRRDRYNDTCDLFNGVWHVLRACKTMEEISQHAPILHQLSQIENEILVLSEGDHAEQYELYSASI